MFIRFANGLLNETNALVTSMLEKLMDIKDTQERMKSAEWSTVAESEKHEILETLAQNERICQSSSELCQETINMLNYLTSDEVIRVPFMCDEILPRFASCLMNVLSKLTGAKSMSIKVTVGVCREWQVCVGERGGKGERGGGEEGRR